MQYTKTVKWLLPVAMIACLASCRKEDDKPIGGKGGNATLYVTPQHHDRNIDSCKIYIRYNAKTAGAYNDSAFCVQVSGKPVATFGGLKKGDYYLYGSGWDAEIDESVIGGTSVTISEEKAYDIYVPVSENHQQ